MSPIVVLRSLLSVVAAPSAELAIFNSIMMPQEFFFIECDLINCIMKQLLRVVIKFVEVLVFKTSGI